MSKKMSMSLRRQIVLMGALVFALALLGIAISQWLSSREFVREQMAAHTQETATSLALALSSALRDGDEALVRTHVLPIFDRGYYRSIIVRDLSGRVIESEEQASTAADVPAWFVRLAHFQPPRAEALASAGWRQAGRVEVVGDVDFALRQLWHGTLVALAWLLAVYALALVIMLAGLRQLLAPMVAVEHIAAAAAGRRIESISIRTRVRELASFIAGFNRLASLFNRRLAEEQDRAEHFRAAALTDRLTALPNRHGLEATLADEPAYAWLGLVEAEGVDELNRTGGYAAGDEFVRAMADCVRQAFPQATVARLHAATFAIVLGKDTGCAEQALREQTLHLFAAMADGAAGQNVVAPLACAAAWHGGDGAASLAAMLAATDLVLAAARAEGSGRVGIHQEAPPAMAGLGARATLRKVEDAIAAEDFALSCQSVFSVPDSMPLQTEIFLRLRGPEGEAWPAQRFFPLVQRERDTGFLDRAMLVRLRRMVDAGRVPVGPLAANVSAATFRDGAPPDWMQASLSHWPATHPLVLEFREADLTASLDAAEHFADALKSWDVAIAIDHFGTHAGGIAALRRLLPQYVKLDPSLSHDLDMVERRFLVESLVRSARSLEIPVWAQVFENPGALELLEEIGIVGAQGYTLATEVVINA